MTQNERTKPMPEKKQNNQKCGDCAHFERCQALFQCQIEAVECDWIPSRFQEKTNADGQI